MTATDTHRPALVPGAVGLPCWPHEGVARAISRIAQLDAKRAHLFLASHTPIRNVRDDRTGGVLGEEDLFRSLMDPTHGEVLALVHGDPGTGKSHLIHWLKLRLDRALESAEAGRIVPVLVRRRTGSLRDALEQLVEQLPPEFGVHLDPVRNALDRISVETARDTLASQLRLELGPRRIDRGGETLRGEWRGLPEIVASKGFREWLSREGGPIDRAVRRLNDPSEVEERQVLPGFSPRDFRIADHRFRDPRVNIESVMDLIDTFDDEMEACERAAELFNEALPDALRQVTGLTGSTLREVFDRIRADLRNDGRELAVFIEDVSIMSALDREVVNAFEPQAREDLCRVVAVVGLTEAGMTGLPQNLKERATHAVSVGQGIAQAWHDDAGEVARFTARYLNTLRLPDPAVREVADSRRRGGDVSASACEHCPIRGECHRAFGAVKLESGVVVGMFPFTPTAPHRLLDHLEEQAGVRRNPRGLLMHIVQRVVADHEALSERQFPSVRLPVRLPALAFWGPFEQRFCAGWSPQQRARLQLLAQGWVDAADAESAAARLQPLLQPLGLPPFSRVVEPQPPGPTGATVVEPEPSRGPAGPEAKPGVNPRVQQLLDDLNSWIAGGRLERERPARELLARMVRDSIAWDDQTRAPLAERRRLLDGYEFIVIEDMRALPRQGRFSLHFERSEETRDLIRALAYFEWEGKGSWAFPDGELYKRTVARWVRRHSERVVDALGPQDGLDPRLPVRAAVQFLCLAAIAGRRTRLPEGSDRTLEALLATPEEDVPGVSDPWRKWMGAIRKHHGKVRDMLLEELSVPQGAGGIVFIDPLPVFDALKGFENAPALDTLDERFFTGFWAPRYVAFQPLADLPALAGSARVESAAVDDLAAEVARTLAEAGFDGNPEEAVQQFFTDLGEVVATQRAVLEYELGSGVDDLGPKTLSDTVKEWAAALAQAVRVAVGTGVLEVLLFDPAPLNDLQERLKKVLQYLNAVEKLVDDELAHIERDGDPDALAEALIASLEAIGSAEQQPEPVEAA